jgi:hypothetical protein
MPSLPANESSMQLRLRQEGEEEKGEKGRD